MFQSVAKYNLDTEWSSFCSHVLFLAYIFSNIYLHWITWNVFIIKLWWTDMFRWKITSYIISSLGLCCCEIFLLIVFSFSSLNLEVTVVVVVVGVNYIVNCGYDCPSDGLPSIISIAMGVIVLLYQKFVWCSLYSDLSCLVNLLVWYDFFSVYPMKNIALLSISYCSFKNDSYLFF